MSITLILNGKQRRKLHLPKQRLAWVGGILFTVLALSGGWLWQSWHQKMEALEVALAMAEQQKSMHLFDPESKIYSRAMKMVHLGASLDEIMLECELPQAEAELLFNLHKQTK